MIKKIFREMGYAPAVLVPRAISLLVVVVFTRVITPEEFGLYALILVYGELLDATLLNWSRLGLLRFYHRGRNFEGLLPGAVLALFLGLLAGAGVGLGLAHSSEATTSLDFYLLLMLYFCGNGLMRFSLNILRAQEKKVRYVIFEIVRPLFGFLAAWILVSVQHASYYWIALGMFSVTAVFSILLFFQLIHSIDWRVTDWFLFKEMMSYSAPLLLVFFCAQVITVSDRYMLNFILGPAAVGVYAAGYALSKPILEILFNIVNLSAFPQLVKAYEEYGDKKAGDILCEKIKIILFMCFPVLSLIVIYAEPLADALIGDSFRENAPNIMRLIAIGAFFAGLKSFVFDQIFHLKRKSLAQSTTLIPAIVFNVVLNAILIPLCGVTGAALATTFGYFIAAMLSYCYSVKYIKINWPGYFSFLVALSTLCAGVVSFILHINDFSYGLLIVVPVYVFLYLLICWKLNVFSSISAV